MAADLPDLFLLSVFRKLSANDRLNASQACPTWCHRVREVNQTLRSLTITLGFKAIDESVDLLTFGYTPCVKEQLIKDEAEKKKKENVPPELLELSTQMNTLLFAGTVSTDQQQQQLTVETVQQIMTAFPAVTELNFLNKSEDGTQFKYLVQMLTLSHTGTDWSQQLSTLRFVDQTKGTVSVNASKRLYKAINRLPALKRLAIDVGNHDGLKLQNLPVLGRLQEVRFESTQIIHLDTFLANVEKYAAGNGQLRIDLPRSLDPHLHQRPLDAIMTSLKPIRKQLVRVNERASQYSFNFQAICTTFPNLISLAIDCSSLAGFAPAFALISKHLPHLRHLSFNLDFTETSDKSYEDFDYDFGDDYDALMYDDEDYEGYEYEDYDAAEADEDAEAEAEADDENAAEEDVDDNVEVNDDNAAAADNDVDDEAVNAVASLPELAHLVDPPPTARLSSMRALEMSLIFTTHADLLWLNLPVTMPNLQTVFLDQYNCYTCNCNSFCFNMVNNSSRLTADELPGRLAAVRGCFEAVLPAFSERTGVPLERIFIRRALGVGGLRTFSAKTLLAEFEENTGESEIIYGLPRQAD